MATSPPPPETIEFSRPDLLDHFEIPAGNYTVWSDEEKIQAEVVARLFALQFVRDFDYKQAALRLGVDEADNPNLVGKKLYNHWLTRHYISEIQDRFFDAGFVTQNKVAALLYRDASNFSPGSNSMARVAAQKTLAEAVGFSGKQKAEAENKAAQGIRGGVVFVKLVESEQEWEKLARENQVKIMREADEDV